MLITEQEAAEARKRAKYKRLQAINPEEFARQRKENIKQRLLSAGDYGNGSVQIFPPGPEILKAYFKEPDDSLLVKK